MLGTSVCQKNSVCLLSLLGRLQGRRFQFLLDSGASCNFVSKKFLEDLDLEWDLSRSQQVKLADGKVLQVRGQVTLEVAFGSVAYKGTFMVLQEQIPVILGMTFFDDVSPFVNWKKKSVHVFQAGKRVQLPVQCYGIKRDVSTVLKSWPGAVVHENPFEVLEVHGVDNDIVHDVDSVPVAAQGRDGCGMKACKCVGGCEQLQHLRNASVQTTHAKGGSVKRVPDQSGTRNNCVSGYKSRVAGKGLGAPAQGTTTNARGCLNCGLCGKRIMHGSICKKCANASFAHFENQLLDQSGSIVDVADVEDDDVSNQKQKPEIVPLNQFTRAGKRGHYISCGVVMLEQLHVDATCDEQLNFTHRHAHGGDGDQQAMHGNLSQLADQELKRLKVKYPSVFEEPVYPVKRSGKVFEHSIPLKDESAEPPKRRLYPLDKDELAELKVQIQELLESNRIEPSQGPYGAPILFAKKKDGRLRMCIDYRLLNAQTKNDVFPLPRIDELLSRLDGARVFSKLDLRDGYHQVPMTEADKPKTAFTCRYGTYQFTVMPFGLMTAPGTFQRMMNTIFFDLLDKGVVIYLDDLLIYSRDVQSHKKLLDEVFALLAKHKLYLKDSKCHLYLERVPFLGHVVDANGVSVEQGKIDCVKAWPRPTNVNQVQQFLGLCNYYRKFVLRFSEIAGPLTLLTRKGQPFSWGEAQQKAFDVLKSCLCSAPTLKIFDSTLQTRVVCDASNFCVGAVLEQHHAESDAWHPVEFFSKRLSQAERNYSATDREFVAIRLSLERWRHFLIGQHFKLLTDHAALTYLHSSAGVHRRNVRWLDFLSQFDFEILHIKGKENIVADALSRVPGSELLTSKELCSMLCTLSVQHVDDVPVKLCDADVSSVPVAGGADVSPNFLYGIISINEKDSFRDQLLKEQQESRAPWFLDICRSARNGSSMFQYRNGLLCKLVEDHFCPVVPESSSSTVQVILSDLHSSALGGHVGRKKLFQLVKRRFYWQNMYRTVEAFCKACPVCQQAKTSTQKPQGLLQPLENPDKCFDHISMDFVVNLPTSSRGYDGIFTIVDRFSRYVHFVPMMTNSSAADVAKLFFEHWLCRFGTPSKIISDRDVRFQSAFWKSLCQCLDSRLAMSTAYHPQTDGLTERYHRSIEQLLRCYCSSQQESWCEYLAQCEFALNATVADAHGFCPFEVIYGFVPQLPLDTSMSLQSQSVQSMVAARALVHSQVSSALAESAVRMKRQADGRRRETSLLVNDKAWLATQNLPLRLGTRKLAAKWTGPFRLVEQVSQEAWKLELPRTWKVHPVFHSSQLKPVHGRPRAPQPIALEDGGPAEEFEVAQLMAKRIVKGKVQYLVRWKGYGAHDDTWEPIDNLKNARAKVRQFEAKQS